jgi:SAM-dependent methyltransferase
MFAPDHRRAALEAARVLRPGGRLGLACWRPDGAIGQFFATIAAHAPPPPPGLQPPPLWGTRDHVADLFADTGLALEFVDGAAHWHFDSVEETVEEYGTKFGPIVMLRSALEPEGRWEALRDDLFATFERLTYGEDDGVAFDGEYLLTLARKA